MRDNNFSAQDILEHEPEILRSEVEESLKSAKTGKAPGIDGISIEIIKAAGEAGVELLWRVCRAVWKDGTAPTEWRQSIIIPIWKRKGDRRECSQYRGISLLSVPGAIPASTIPTPIPAHLFDSDSSHLGYDSDSDSNIIFMNDSDSDSDSIPTAALLIL